MNEPQFAAQTPILFSETLVKLPEHKFYRQTFIFEELLAIMLWAVTRISYDVNCLVEGTKARAIQPAGGWEQGTIRLLAIVSLKASHSVGDSEDKYIEIDCKTKQPPNWLLTDTAVIQSDNNLVCREPRQVGAILRELKQELQTACVETTDFLVPTRLGFPAVELLEPGREWRHAQMRLGLEISFISDRPRDSQNPPRTSSALPQPVLPLGENLTR
ncbi:MAG TPA: hypothetical protein IGS52_21225 [Oscillatoriaceae cyanobacterium M33_DOE_052]|uniref:Uncharacterized protein n=1 Tax=Planktothricoides sp. SpSt-374 TaxID=2282167 RepID=A0A7C3ZVI1_9CYAN|nr:hypothetical protein [Oscillatoriaceae cyanobacterium M33_DOE_052]